MRITISLRLLLVSSGKRFMEITNIADHDRESSNFEPDVIKPLNLVYLDHEWRGSKFDGEIKCFLGSRSCRAFHKFHSLQWYLDWIVMIFDLGSTEFDVESGKEFMGGSTDPTDQWMDLNDKTGKTLAYYIELLEKSCINSFCQLK